MVSSAGQNTVAQSTYASIDIPFPPLNEQKRIVAKIEELYDRLSRSKQALEAVPQLCDRFRQSVLTAAFRGDLTADWREENPDVELSPTLLERVKSEPEKISKSLEPLVEEQLTELPHGWTWVTVEHLGIDKEQTVLTGPFGATLGREDFVNEGIPVITIGCLQERGLELKKAMYVRQSKADELERYKLREGDFLFSRMASVGRAAIAPKNLSGAIFNYHLMRLRLTEEFILKKYFLYYIQGSNTVSQYVKYVNHGATRDGINTQQLSKMPVALPPLQEQHEIVEIVEKYFGNTHDVEDRIDSSFLELELLNQPILAKAFRGELVEQDPNDEPASVLLERIRAERSQSQPTKKSPGTRGKRKAALKE